MTRSARVLAFAKVNLGLRVLYQRPDGYHELRTVFQTISLTDTLEISYRRGRATSVLVEGTPDIPDNIAARAAHRILETLQVSGAVRILLSKKIPSGGGLGGGSSDAAAVLLTLPVLIGRRLESGVLKQIAAKLGSDVPFFLLGGRALGLGRGEELYPLPEAAGIKGLLVVPAIHSSTAQAYLDLAAELTLIPLQNKLSTFQQEIWQGSKVGCVNDFEPVVCARHPRIAAIRERLRRLGAGPVAMTGSGSAVFGIFKSPARLRRAREAFPDDQTFPISFLSRSQYRARWRRSLAPHIETGKQGVEQWPPLSLYAR